MGGLASTAPPRIDGNSVSCNLLVKDGYRDLGYISPVWNQYGQYGTLQPTATGALEVELSYDSTSPERLDVWTTNGPDSDFPVFGAAMGFSTDGVNMNLGSINYAYIAGAPPTQPHSPAVPGPNSFTNKTGFDASVQGFIWQYDPATGALSPQWTNWDSSTPQMHILYAENERTLCITGDPTTFNKAIGASYSEVLFMLLLTILVSRTDTYRMNYYCMNTHLSIQYRGNEKYFLVVSPHAPSSSEAICLDNS
ncbi:hypothetical protein FRC12_008992 [Ceratobasidium sp. 428]|nr:hypothetical protein FRC12_008992 [Ceratobasidium sp. 428]